MISTLIAVLWLAPAAMAGESAPAGAAGVAVMPAAAPLAEERAPESGQKRTLATLIHAARLKRARQAQAKHGAASPGPVTLAGIIADLRWREDVVRRLYGRSDSPAQSRDRPPVSMADAE